MGQIVLLTNNQSHGGRLLPAIMCLSQLCLPKKAWPLSNLLSHIQICQGLYLSSRPKPWTSASGEAWPLFINTGPSV